MTAFSDSLIQGLGYLIKYKKIKIIPLISGEFFCLLVQGYYQDIYKGTWISFYREKNFIFSPCVGKNNNEVDNFSFRLFASYNHLRPFKL